MRVEYYDNPTEPVKAPATRVLIYDDNGNPLVFAVKIGENHVRIGTINDKDFFSQLQNHGFDKVRVLSKNDIRRLSV